MYFVRDSRVRLLRVNQEFLDQKFLLKRGRECCNSFVILFDSCRLNYQIKQMKRKIEHFNDLLPAGERNGGKSTLHHLHEGRVDVFSGDFTFTQVLFGGSECILESLLLILPV